MNASDLIDGRINELDDWRGEYVTKLRKLLYNADPEIIEDWKWGSPVFTHNGLVCSIGSFSDHVKLHFFQGANFESKLYNAGLEAKTTRGIDFFENDPIKEQEIISLIKEAVTYNSTKK